MARLARLLALTLGISIATPLVATELVLSAPPRETSAVAEKTYAPLAKFLSKQLGQKVVYRHPKSWALYTSALRDGEYDFVFDGPHFVSWRMVHLQHQPLVKLPGTLRFVVVTAAANGGVTKLSDLRSGSLCGMASPNLATSAVLAEYGPVASPAIVVGKGGLNGIVEEFNAGGCDAMILRDSFLEKMAEDKRTHLKVIYTSAEFANQTLTAGSRVPAEQLGKLTESLVGEEGIKAFSEIINRFADKNTKSMALAKAEEFKGNNRLLEGVVWGW